MFVYRIFLWVSFPSFLWGNDDDVTRLLSVFDIMIVAVVGIQWLGLEWIWISVKRGTGKVFTFAIEG